MTIRLGSNISSLTAQRKLADSTAALSKTFERLSSGQRINRASDDAAGLSIADSLKASGRISIQGVRNLNDGLSLLSIADSSIENLSEIVMRLEELAAQAANGVYTNKQRKAMDDEAQALSKEFFRISKATEFNGQRLLGGEFDSINLQAGVGANAVLSAGVGGAIGTGSFTHSPIPFTGIGAGHTSIGDLNGDGIADLVTSNQSDGTIAISLGIGGGSFNSPVAYNAGGFARENALADFNGDGVLDIAQTREDVGPVQILLGRGDGSFTLGSAVSLGSVAPVIETGDFNGDGIVDLVSGVSTVLGVALGRGDGTFQAAITKSVSATDWMSITVGDFNHDGLDDIGSVSLAEGTVSVFLGLGDGTFSVETSYAVGLIPQDITSADLNGDGNLDLINTDRNSQTVSVFLGTGTGTFGPRTSYALGAGSFGRQLFAEDFNGDGFVDITVANSGNGLVSVLLGNGSGGLSSNTTFNVGGTGLHGVSAGDVNGDGVADIVASDYFGGARLLIGNTRDGVAPLLPFSLQSLADARQALPVFQRKRELLAAQRGEIGAFQSRIDVARNVLEVSSENFRAAESRIRDADIAEESSQLVRLNILQQAASSILAQANQQPALALQLLSAR